MSVFGDNLKAVRLAKGMTLVQSADALGITNPALSQWEQGKREPKFDMLIELCNLFGTTPNELLGFEPLRVSFNLWFPFSPTHQKICWLLKMCLGNWIVFTKMKFGALYISFSYRCDLITQMQN